MVGKDEDIVHVTIHLVVRTYELVFSSLNMLIMVIEFNPSCFGI